MLAFRHAIGKSTLTEGIAVPKSFECWVEAPEPGRKRKITLLFDDLHISATLRRLANARGHVQVKYENREGLRLREWLMTVFAASRDGLRGEYLELQRIEADVFRIVAFPVGCQPALRLEISEWIFHRTDERVFRRLAPLREIPAIICNVELKAHEGQQYYNRQLAQRFTEWNW